jgi:putative isomerase
MAIIARGLNMPEDVKQYNEHADSLIQLMSANFWDDSDGMYYDRNEKTGKLVKVKSATCFTPLFAGAVPTDRAKRTIREHLLNEKEFWLSYPVASYAKTEPDYYQGSHNECNWRGPSWAPTNYMIFQGLQRYGYHAEAKVLANRLLDMALIKNPVLREYYDAETGLGIGQTRFWGFTALYYGMRLEWELHYDASSLEQSFEPIIPHELGIPFEVPA